MRVLVAASGGEGHLGPLLPFVAAARDSGDVVELVVPPAQKVTAESTGAVVHLTGVPPNEKLRQVHADLQSGDRSVRVRAAEIELFAKLNTSAALSTMFSVAEAFEPDLILREPCDYASAVVATRLGTRHASVGISPGKADLSGLDLAGPVIENWAEGVTASVRAAPYLTRFPLDQDSGFADTRRYGFGRRISQRARADGTPVVWLTMGTINTGFDQVRGTWEAAVEALSTLPVRVVASVGRSGTPFAPASNVEVHEWVDLDEILGVASAVVCHGGSGTTLAALAAGVPVVCVPMIADQPSNASMAESRGAGLVVTPPVGHTVQGLSASDIPRLRSAIVRVLDEPQFRLAAENIAAEYERAPTVRTCWNELRE